MRFPCRDASICNFPFGHLHENGISRPEPKGSTKGNKTNNFNYYIMLSFIIQLSDKPIIKDNRLDTDGIYEGSDIVYKWYLMTYIL